MDDLVKKYNLNGNVENLMLDYENFNFLDEDLDKEKVINFCLRNYDFSEDFFLDSYFDKNVPVSLYGVLYNPIVKEELLNTGSVEKTAKKLFSKFGKEVRKGEIKYCLEVLVGEKNMP
jgi:hypothetical protein